MSDPNFNDVSLLLLMNGTDGSTTFTDSSSNAYTVTANGNAQIDTAESKYGGASGLFDGTGDYLSVPNSSQQVIDIQDTFTIELWAYLDVLSVNQFLVSTRPTVGGTSTSRGFGMSVNAAGELRLIGWSSGGGFTQRVSSGAGITTGTWTHLAVVYDGTNIQGFVDGVSVFDIAHSPTTWANTSAPFYVGALASSPDIFFDGQIDDLRVTKGVARYTSNFTPPTAELPTSGAATAYTLDLGAGSYSLSGSALTFVTSATTYSIDLDAGSYTVSGSDVGLVSSRVISIESETFILAGSNLNLAKAIPIQLDAGTFTLTGADVTLARGATIVSQPTDVTVNQPADAVFTVLAIHPQGRELTYQWYEDGVALTGETGTTLTINSPAGSESGNEYYVIVTDTSDGSTVQSNTATLTVNGAILEPAVICPKRSYTAGAEPTTDDIIEGEVAINITDGKLWIRDGSNNIVLLGGLQDNWGLPTSDPAVAGEFWNDSGTLKVSNG